MPSLKGPTLKKKKKKKLEKLEKLYVLKKTRVAVAENLTLLYIVSSLSVPGIVLG